MEDEDILRGIGIKSEYLEQYQKMRRAFTRAFAFVIGAGTLPIPALIVAMFFVMQNNYFLVMITSAIWFIPASISAMYLMIILFKTSSNYAKIIEETWLIWPAARFIENSKVRKLMIIGTVEMFFVGFILGYLVGEVLIMLLSFLFLGIVPALNFAKKDTMKIGYHLNHLYKGNVDDITDKLTIELGGKKKLLVKSQSERRYLIELPDRKEIKIYIFRRADKKDFTEVSISGVKIENVGEVSELISRIEKTLHSEKDYMNN